MATAKKSAAKKATPRKAPARANTPAKTAAPVARPAAKAPAPVTAPAKPAAKAKPAPAPTAAKPAKPPKVKKPKQVRDSFTMPKTEYAVLEALKLRAGKLAGPAKKSELLRAGVKALAAMSDVAFLASLKAVPAIKTGRPKLSKD